jgi:hypothetical protein
MFFSRVTLLAKVLNVNSSSIKRFVFSSPSNEFLNNSIDVENEDVLYNWMNRASMSISKVDKPFLALKEMHFSTIQTLIDVYSKTRSSIMDLFASTCMCSFSKKSFTISAFKKKIDHLSPYMQHN